MNHRIVKNWLTKNNSLLIWVGCRSFPPHSYTRNTHLKPVVIRKNKGVGRTGVGNAEKKSFHMTRNKMYLYEMETQCRTTLTYTDCIIQLKLGMKEEMNHCRSWLRECWCVI